MCQIDFYPEVWGWPLVLGDYAEGPSTEANILAQELNKLYSSNKTITTVQNSWYCTIIRENKITMHVQIKCTDEYSTNNMRLVDYYETHRWVLEGAVWLQWAPQTDAQPESPPLWSPHNLPESLEQSAPCTYNSSQGQQHHHHQGIALSKNKHISEAK